MKTWYIQQVNDLFGNPVYFAFCYIADVKGETHQFYTLQEALEYVDLNW